jgi:DNA-binding MarR family transcriptional regulator
MTIATTTPSQSAGSLRLQQRPHPGACSDNTEPAYQALIRTMGLLRRAMEPCFTRHGISASQWFVLCALNKSEKSGTTGLRLTDLSDSLLVRPPSVTGVVDRLQRMGLVARKASHKDQRAKLVSLTVAGRRLVERVRQGHADQVQKVLAVLSIPEQHELHRLLDRLGEHLGAMNGNGSEP